MTTFATDFVRLCLPVTQETVNLSCRGLGVEWPPPPVLRLVAEGMGVRVLGEGESAGTGRTWRFARESYSALSDEVMASATHVARGALYRLEHPEPTWP